MESQEDMSQDRERELRILIEHKRMLIELVNNHIDKLAFCAYKYRGEPESMYDDHKRKFEHIREHLVRLLEETTDTDVS